MRFTNHRSELFAKAICLITMLCLLAGATPLSPTVRAGGPPGEHSSCGNTRDYDKSLDEGDPLAVNSGAYHFTKPLLDLGGPMDLHFSLTYRSDFTRHTPVSPEDLGPWARFWWSPKYTAHFSNFGDEQAWTVQTANGNSVGFEKRGDEWVLVGPTDYWGNVDTGSAIRYRLKETGDYLYFMDPMAERVYIFEKLTPEWAFDELGRITDILDRNGNQLTYTYSEADHNNPARIEDGLGRSLDFTYENLGTPEERLSRVTDQAGRQVSFDFEYAADNDDDWTLRSVTDPMSHTTTFTYTTVQNPWLGFEHTDNIAAVQRPEGNIPYTQLYTVTVMRGTQAVRVAEQRDAYGNATALTYDTDQNQVTADRPDGNTVVYRHYSHHGMPKGLTDATGETITFTKNITEQLTSVTDRLGDTTNVTYHPETGKLASVTNNKGDVISYTYAAQTQTFTNPISPTETVTFTFYNLSRMDYPDGTYEQFAYDDYGNVTTYTDQAGQTWTYTYNDRGQVLTAANPAGGVTTYTYNADGTLASSTDSDTGVTAYGYDAYKRLITITHPDGTVQIGYDLNDRVTAITDERGKTYTYEYDANGNLVKATDPAGEETTYARDLMDRVTRRTDRRSETTQSTYDEMGRIASVTDPNGNTHQLDYDSRGWLNQITDPAGKAWRTAYDDEGVVISTTTPLNRTTTFGRDRLGYITAITDPLGNTATFTRDELSRVTAATDPLGHTTTYAYDERGLLAGVTLPDGGSASYDYNNLGLLSAIHDLNGNVWSFDHTAMGRLQSQTDPLGNTWVYTYNQRGLLEQIAYPTGETQTRTYDAAGNLTRRQYSAGLDLNFGYDDLSRITSADGITLTYDAVGQVVNTQNPSTSFGASYDDGGRLETVSYNGLFSVTYQYDTRDLLTQVSDGLTGATVQFTYDDDRRLIGVERSNGVDATLTWDGASRLTRIQEGSLADMQYTYNAAGEVIQAALDLPLDPAAYLAEQLANLSYDDASQNNSPGYTYDARGRLTASPGHTYTWDGASRLVGIDDVALTYNGLGDLTTRSEGGGTIHYYYNYALGLTPIVAEKDEATGQFLRYYIWTPGGKLLYMIDASAGNAVRFYHFDRAGSTLALTDDSGALTDAYAYDSYGNLLEHTGGSDQRFRYVGQYGVRWEPAGGLYHMRVRYYDPATARFLTRDPVWPRIADPQTLSPYQYAAAAPTMWIDPTGLNDDDIVDIGALSEKLTKQLVRLDRTLAQKLDEALAAAETPEQTKKVHEEFLPQIIELQKEALSDMYDPEYLEGARFVEELGKLDVGLSQYYRQIHEEYDAAVHEATTWEEFKAARRKYWSQRIWVEKECLSDIYSEELPIEHGRSDPHPVLAGEDDFDPYGTGVQEQEKEQKKPSLLGQREAVQKGVPKK